MATETPNETPHANLRQLAELIRKPSTTTQSPSNGDRSPQLPLPKRTPSAGGRTPGVRVAGRPVPTKRATPTTPHTIRALQRRRAVALAAEKTKRRSGKQQRETPRDALRLLSKILAKDSQAVQSSPLVANPQPEGALASEDDDDLENEPELTAPRLSLAFDEEEDSLQLPPEETSMNPDENLTQRSVELPRRAYGGQFRTRSSRGSFGSIRLSDRFGDFNEIETAESPDREDFGFVGPDVNGVEEEIEDEDAEEEEEEEQDDQAEEEMVIPDDTDIQHLNETFSDETLRRQSDFQPVLQPERMDESTSAFELPQPTESLLASPEHQSEEMNQTMTQDQAEPAEPAPKDPQPRPRPKKVLKVSRHGIPYPSLPANVVKKLAMNFARSGGRGKPQISKDTLEAIMEASDWFFEQVSDDLGAYATHAGRRMINESDMITLMKRQRQINAKATPFSLAQRYLPRELLQDIRMTPPQRPGKMRKRKLEVVEEAEEDD